MCLRTGCRLRNEKLGKAVTYDRWKCSDPNEPFAEHEEEQMPMPTEPSELLPCPFCGSPATTIGPYGGEMLFGVQCLQCNARVSGFDQCKQDARDAWNTRAAPAQGEPVAQAIEYARRLNDLAVNCEVDDRLGDASDLRRIAQYLAAFPSSPALPGAPHNSGERLPSSDAAGGAGEAISPADLAEDCAKIAEGHVGAGGYPGNELEDRCRRIGYDDACRDIAKAIRDVHGGLR